MNYEIKVGSVVIGTSELEHADSGMGMRHGIFIPSNAYSEFKSAFDEYYKAISKMTGNPGVVIPEYQSASNRIDSFNLALFSGEERVPVENIEITDCSTVPELSGEPIEVSVVVKNSATYEKVFKNY